MKTKVQSPSTTRINAFTIIEMLVVLAIITILAGLLLPALSKSREQAKKAAAGVQINGIGLALKGYYNEYGTWPTDNAGSVPTNNPLSANQLFHLYQLLSGRDVFVTPAVATVPGGNARQIVFMEFKSDNLLVTGSITNIVDGWGTPFQVKLDDNGDNQTEVYVNTTNSAPFAIWSNGKDLQYSTTLTSPLNSDNVTSWK